MVTRGSRGTRKLSHDGRKGTCSRMTCDSRPLSSEDRRQAFLGTRVPSAEGVPC